MSQLRRSHWRTSQKRPTPQKQNLKRGDLRGFGDWGSGFCLQSCVRDLKPARRLRGTWEFLGLQNDLEALLEHVQDYHTHFRMKPPSDPDPNSQTSGMLG